MLFVERSTSPLLHTHSIQQDHLCSAFSVLCAGPAQLAGGSPVPEALPPCRGAFTDCRIRVEVLCTFYELSNEQNYVLDVLLDP